MRRSFRRKSDEGGHHDDHVEEWLTPTARYERVLYGLEAYDADYSPSEVEAWMRDAPFIRISGEGPILLCPDGHDSFRIDAFVGGYMPLTCSVCGVVMDVALDDVPDVGVIDLVSTEGE